MRHYMMNGKRVFDASELKPGDIVMVQLYPSDVETLRLEGRITDVTSGQFVGVFRQLDEPD